jgi:hypothetical protein
MKERARKREKKEEVGGREIKKGVSISRSTALKRWSGAGAAHLGSRTPRDP